MVIQRLRPLFAGQGVQVEVLCRELARRGVRATIITAGHGPNPLALKVAATASSPA